VVEFDDAVWRTAEARFEEDPEWVLAMLLEPAGGSVGLVAAIREWGLGREATYVAHPDRLSGSVPGPGAWECMSVARGVLLQVTECDDYRAAFEALRVELERRGVEGRISLWDEPTGVRAPAMQDLLVCRVSIRGIRVHDEPEAYEWRPDPFAYQACADLVDSWFGGTGSSVLRSLQMGSMPPVPIAAHEPVADRLIESMAASAWFRAVAIGPGEFRVVGAKPHSGRICLMAGVTDGASDWWQAPLAEFRGVLRDAGHLFTYAFVRRGWDVYSAFGFQPVARDWPFRSEYEPRGRGFASAAFDDLVVPDAFGLQLIGPDHAKRLDIGPSWQAEETAGGVLLLAHAEPDQWFGASFVPLPPPRSSRWVRDEAANERERPIPEVLARARDDLAPILYTRATLSELGYDDLL
jgi:hypothetical protein